MRKRLWLILILSTTIIFSISCNTDTGIISDINQQENNQGDENSDTIKKTRKQDQMLDNQLQKNKLVEVYIQSFIKRNQFYHQIDNKEGFEKEYIIGGEKIGISLVFDKEINLESFKEQLQINDGTFTDYELDGKNYPDDKYRIYLSFLRLEDIIDYKITISKELHDKEVNQLSDDIEFTIHAYPPTFVSYTLIKENGKRDSIDVNSYDREFSWLHLTPNPKTFQLTFSNDIDQNSIVNSIDRGLKEKASASYQWINDRILEIKLNNFEIEKHMDNEISISMDKGKDMYGNGILDSLYFRVGFPNTLGYLDLETLDTVDLYTFNDYKVIPHLMKAIDDYLIIYDSKTKKGQLFNMHTQEFEREISLLGTMYEHDYINWVDRNIALAFDEGNRKISKVNLIDNQVTDVVDLSNLDINYEAYVKIKEMKISPDKEKIAFIVGEYDYPPKLFVYTIKDRAFQQFAFQSYYIGWPLPHIQADLEWLDNQTLQYITKEIAKPDTLERLNIYTGETETVIKGKLHAKSKDESIYIISRPVEWDYGTANRYYIIKNNEEILINDNELVESQDRKTLTNFQFINENEIVYNDEEYDQKDKIFLYNIQEDTEKEVGDGRIFAITTDGKILAIKGYYIEENLLYIYDQEGNKETIEFNGRPIGLSSDKKRVYYLTNYENIYSIP